MLLVTLKITVQLPLAGMVMPLKLSAVAPPVRLLGVVPTQVPVTLPPAAFMLPNVSENEAFVRVDVLGLPSVRVTVELLPD